MTTALSRRGVSPAVRFARRNSLGPLSALRPSRPRVCRVCARRRRVRNKRPALVNSDRRDVSTSRLIALLGCAQGSGRVRTPRGNLEKNDNTGGRKKNLEKRKCRRQVSRSLYWSLPIGQRADWHRTEKNRFRNGKRFLKINGISVNAGVTEFKIFFLIRHRFYFCG